MRRSSRRVPWRDFAFGFALAAQPTELDDLLMHFESVRGRRGGKALGELAAGNLDGFAATLANEELALMRFAHLAAGDERIARLDPMHEAVLDEKVECAIDGRGRDPPALGFERGEQVIRADRLARARDERIDLPA